MARNHLFASLPRFRKGALGLFAVTLVATALLADQPIGRDLLLAPGGVLRGEGLWQPLTATFMHPDGGAGLVLGTLIAQWLLGSRLEEFWGTRKYVTLVLGCSVAGYLVSVALATFVPAVAETIVGGSSGLDLAAVAAFGVVFGDRRMSLLGAVTLTARTLAIIIAVLGIVSPLARGAPWPVVVPWVVAIASALLVATQPWRRKRSSGKLGGRNKPSKRRSHLRVVKQEDELLN